MSAVLCKCRHPHAEHQHPNVENSGECYHRDPPSGKYPEYSPMADDESLCRCMAYREAETTP